MDLTGKLLEAEGEKRQEKEKKKRLKIHSSTTRAQFEPFQIRLAAVFS